LIEKATSFSYIKSLGL